MKASIDALAIFGGQPLFRAPRPIGQLDAPDVADYLALVRESFEARHLTNDGPILRRLERKLADLHETRHCVAVANAGLGIMMLIQLFARGRRGDVIMPAFSYRGLPHFAQWAGQMPRFCDVELSSHTLDPAAVAAAISARTTSILAVGNFNSPGDIDGLCRVAERHDIPIFFDSVYAIGSTYRGKVLGSFGRAEVFSLHATKLLNGFEGGYVTTNDEDIAQKLRWQRNFTLPALKPDVPDCDEVVGMNAKLNELHAAMAYLSVDAIEGIIEANKARYHAYQDEIAGIPGLQLVSYAAGERANYQMAVVEVGETWPLTRDETLRVLRAEGTMITAYYSPALHRSEHCPADAAVPSLPASEWLAKRFLQLPVGALTSNEDVRRVCGLLSFISRHGRQIASRMKQQQQKWL